MSEKFSSWTTNIPPKPRQNHMSQKVQVMFSDRYLSVVRRCCHCRRKRFTSISSYPEPDGQISIKLIIKQFVVREIQVYFTEGTHSL